MWIASSRESGVCWARVEMLLKHGVFVGLSWTGRKLAESELVGLARFASKREYTPEVFHSSEKTRQKSSNVAFGGLLGGPLTAQQSELITLWDQLTVDQQQSVLGLARLLVSKKHECD